MMTSPNPVLVWPKEGNLYRFDDVNGTFPLPIDAIKNTITSDGYGSRMVITVNGLFPGPSIVAFEGQQIIIHVQNRMRTESTAIHWHGIQQFSSVYSDGVPYITQCPILPGQNYTYIFEAKQHGTHFYHSQIGNQRSMGLYGALIINPKTTEVPEIHEGFTVLLQDWNHNDDPETSYLRMIDGVFNLDTRKYEHPTHSVDGTNFSSFRFHSGLINGMGRFYRTKSLSNESPLQIFEVEESKPYLFRVISAATLYPFRVYIEGHPVLTIEASDGHDIVNNVHTASTKLVVESFIIYPGERIDFTVHAVQEPGTYLLVAESLEVLDPSVDEYHAAEAILHYAKTPYISNPPKATPNTCTLSKPCITFNCPFLYYPQGANRICWNLDSDAYSKNPEIDFQEVYNVSQTLFFNFGFNGDLVRNPGSVNGRQFVFPAEPVLYRTYGVARGCEKANCGQDAVCQCTFYERLEKDVSYQLVLSNIGDGQGWSQPIHLHGTGFFVVKIGFGTYDRVSAKYLQETNDIHCDGRMKPSMCNSERWKVSTWDTPNAIPGIKLKNPPIKDTIVVPSGGYVVIRFKAKNPGPWFFHSQVDLHTSNGMAMIFQVGPVSESPMVDNPHACWVQKDTGGDNRSINNSPSFDNQEYCLFMDVYSDLKPTPCMLICRLTKEETLWTSGALQKGECEE
ncbi:uncharacterized protein LOC111102119 [Crassostrea virginica]